jgi:uncharacterized Tic20 family protein
MKLLRAVGRFFYDFFVGDTPEIFISVVLVLLCSAVAGGTAPWIILSGAVATLLWSLRRARPHS